MEGYKGGFMDNNDSDKPKWLPYVVIAIWLLLGTLIGVAVLANNPKWNRALELTVQLVTAFSGAAAAIAAFLAVRAANQTLNQAREDRQAEIEGRRPKFRLMRDYMDMVTQYEGDTSVDSFYNLGLVFKNIHAHPAKFIHLSCKVLQGEKKLLDFESSPVREINQDETFEVNPGINIYEMDEGIAYVRIMLTYVDSVTQKEHSQLEYRKFYGPFQDDERTKIQLTEIDRSEWHKYQSTHKRIVQARQK
jgi:hypothetical protein